MLLMLYMMRFCAHAHKNTNGEFGDWRSVTSKNIVHGCCTGLKIVVSCAYWFGVPNHSISIFVSIFDTIGNSSATTATAVEHTNQPIRNTILCCRNMNGAFGGWHSISRSQCMQRKRNPCANYWHIIITRTYISHRNATNSHSTTI